MTKQKPTSIKTASKFDALPMIKQWAEREPLRQPQPSGWGLFAAFYLATHGRILRER